MNKSMSVNTRGKKAGPLFYILRALITGAAAFTLCIIIIPLILMNTNTPEDYISVSAAITVSLVALFSAIAATAGSGRHFLSPGLLCGLTIILLLVCASLIFGKSDEDKNYLFSGILYALSIVFSIVGARLASKKNKKSKKRRR